MRRWPTAILRARRTAELAIQGTAALASGDVGAIAGVLTRSAQHVLEKVSEADVMDYGQQAIDAVRELPHGDVLVQVFEQRTRQRSTGCAASQVPSACPSR